MMRLTRSPGSKLKLNHKIKLTADEKDMAAYTTFIWKRPKRKAVFCEILKGEENKHLPSTYHVPGLSTEIGWSPYLQYTDEEAEAQ